MTLLLLLIAAWLAASIVLAAGFGLGAAMGYRRSIDDAFLARGARRCVRAVGAGRMPRGDQRSARAASAWCAGRGRLYRRPSTPARRAGHPHGVGRRRAPTALGGRSRSGGSPRSSVGTPQRRWGAPPEVDAHVPAAAATAHLAPRRARATADRGALASLGVRVLVPLLGVTTALASVGVAGAVGVLPAPAGEQLRSVVSTITWLELRDDDTERTAAPAAVAANGQQVTASEPDHPVAAPVGARAKAPAGPAPTAGLAAGDGAGATAAQPGAGARATASAPVVVRAPTTDDTDPSWATPAERGTSRTPPVRDAATDQVGGDTATAAGAPTTAPAPTAPAAPEGGGRGPGTPAAAGTPPQVDGGGTAPVAQPDPEQPADERPAADPPGDEPKPAPGDRGDGGGDGPPAPPPPPVVLPGTAAPPAGAGAGPPAAGPPAAGDRPAAPARRPPAPPAPGSNGGGAPNTVPAPAPGGSGTPGPGRGEPSAPTGAPDGPPAVPEAEADAPQG